MTTQTATLFIDAALFGLATAGVFMVLAIIGVCVYNVYQAVYSPKAKRRRAFDKRLATNRAHYRKMLGLA